MKIDIQVEIIEQKSLNFDLSDWIDLAKENDGCLLYSGNKEREGVHLLGFDPLVELTSEWMKIEKNYYFIDDPLGIIKGSTPLSTESDRSNKKKDTSGKGIKSEQVSPNPHFSGGWLGYFSYDAKSLFEQEQVYPEVKVTWPLLHFYLYKSIFLYQNGFITKYEQGIHISKIRNIDISPQRGFSFDPLFQVDDSESRYMEGVREIKENILDGELYQANLSFKRTGLHGYLERDLVRGLLISNTGSLQGYFCTRNYSLVSTSPESFFIQSEGKLTSSPIKGTLPRLRAKDEEQKEKLFYSKKDRAELAMIVDLLRNDLHKISDNVMVGAFPELTTYQDVHHLSVRLVAETMAHPIDVLSTLFPGGSITGCPKIKACEKIHLFEQEGRGPYTGAMGYFSLKGAAQFNLLIRSVLLQNEKYAYRVGGGITLLSDPQLEYQEACAKGALIEKVLNDEK